MEGIDLRATQIRTYDGRIVLVPNAELFTLRVTNNTATPTPEHPLMIEVMRRRDYPGSELTIEETLPPGENYDRFIASYLSDGNRINALLTVPWGAPPPSGWPVIIFNHGWIPPDEYVTELRYVCLLYTSRCV